MRLQDDLARKLVHAKFLDDLEDVDLFAQLLLRVLEKQVASLALRSAAATVPLVEAPQAPEARVLVGESLSLLNLVHYFVPLACFEVLIILLLRR